MRLIQLALVAVLAVGAVAWADHDIDIPYEAPEGTATIDGDLSDWADAEWILLDSPYGDPATTTYPADITEAKYALRWDDANNKLVVAVTANDSEQYLADDFIDWNGQCDIELYVDAGNKDMDYTGLQDYAQQIFVGVKPGNTGSWVFGSAGHPIMPNLIAAGDFAGQVNGDVLTYEVAITPYGYYDEWGGAAEPEYIVDLEAGITVGFDVAVVSLYNGKANLNFATNNTIISKWRKGYALQSWLLVTGGGTPGDLDGDGDVDLDDFVILKQSFGVNANGDCDGDGDTDLDDFVILKQNFGT